MREEIFEAKICKIHDARLNNYSKRLRTGSTQVFYTGNDERDFERYKKDEQSGVTPLVMYYKPDTISIEPPKISWYAKLFEDGWWWVEGCRECNGHARDWMTYIECNEHNRCRTCGVKSGDLPEGVVRWGGKPGWQCGTCHDIEHERLKQEALNAMPEGHDESDYEGLAEITCPWCNLQWEDSFESAGYDREEVECPRCDNKFKVTAVTTLSFDCERC